MNLNIGSKICTQCISGYTWDSSNLICSMCGDGKVYLNEVCDDGALGGCLSDCLGAHDGYKCSGGNTTSPTICIKIEV